jgi:hypothetical protein
VTPFPAIEPITLPSRRRTRMAVGFTLAVLVPVVGFSVARIMMPPRSPGDRLSAAERSVLQREPVSPPRADRVAVERAGTAPSDPVVSPPPAPSALAAGSRPAFSKKRATPALAVTAEPASVAPTPAPAAPASASELPHLSKEFE